jgi:hypothetical protein
VRGRKTDPGPFRATEAQSVKRLLEARARTDIRAERLSAHRKRITLYEDLIVHDLGFSAVSCFCQLCSWSACQKRARNNGTGVRPAALSDEFKNALNDPNKIDENLYLFEIFTADNVALGLLSLICLQSGKQHL